MIPEGLTEFVEWCRVRGASSVRVAHVCVTFGAEDPVAIPDDEHLTPGERRELQDMRTEKEEAQRREWLLYGSA